MQVLIKHTIYSVLSITISIKVLNHLSESGVTLECISSGFDVAPDEGWLQRAVKVNGQLHIIEELQLFEEPQPVDSIVISEKQV